MKLTEQIEKEYGQIEKKEIKDINVPKSLNLQKTLNIDTLLDLYVLMQQDTLFERKPIFRNTRSDTSEDTDNCYHYIEEQIRHRVINKTLSYTPEDITSLSFQVTRTKSEHTISQLGLFLSALINENFRRKKRESLYFIYAPDEEKFADTFTDPFIPRVDFLGYKNNGAHILIIGAVGNGLCKKMSKGNITLDGTCKDTLLPQLFVGQEMSGGSLIITGDVFGSCGYQMQGGSITVNGEVKKEDLVITNLRSKSRIGFMMNGGTITINEYHGKEIGIEMTGGIINIETGECDISPRKKGGNIYYKGMLQETENKEK